VLVSEPRVAGATFAGELYRRRTLQPLHAGLPLKSPRVSLPGWLPGVVFVHALAENGTSSMAMARRTGRPDREHSPLPASTLLLHHRLAAASRVTILLCDSVHVLRRRFRLSRIQGEVGPRG
jgi:hypothetical protein